MDRSDGAIVARLVAIGMVLWAVYSSIGYSVDNFPAPSARVPESASPSPVDAIAEVEMTPEPLQEPYLRTAAFSPGAYAVGDSPDPQVARRDRDYRPSRRLFVDDDRVVDSDDRDADQDADDEDRDPDDEDADDREADDRPSTRRVQGQIEPGLYGTDFDASDCSYELWRVMQDRDTKVIAEEHLSEGRVLVSINGIEPDWITSTAGCGDWYPWEPMPTPLTSADDGDYWIGDLAHGVWFVPRPCRWEVVVAFRGADIDDVVDSGAGPGSLTIDDDTLGVRLRGCRTSITLTSPAGGAPAP